VTRQLPGRTETVAAIVLTAIACSACEDLAVRNPASLLAPVFQRSEVIGFLAGLGTTFAGLPDLISMLRKRSSAGVNPRMAGIMAAFQVLWIYYGLLIASRPVIVWNFIAVCVNALLVRSYFRFR